MHPLIIQVLYHTEYLPEPERRADEASKNREWTAQYLAILDRHLQTGRRFLLGDRFTIADIDVGSVVNQALSVQIEAGPATRAWMGRLRSRPAYQRALTAG